MAASKKSAKARGSVRFRDLKAKKSPKGGAINAFIKMDGITGNASATPTVQVTDKYTSTIKFLPIG
jgi:hypothetical protein